MKQLPRVVCHVDWSPDRYTLSTAHCKLVKMDDDDEAYLHIDELGIALRASVLLRVLPEIVVLVWNDDTQKWFGAPAWHHPSRG